MAPAQSHGSATEATPPAQTLPPDASDTDSVACSVAADQFSNENDRSTTDILRADLRQWFTSHDPTTLLEQQDWTWMLDGSAISCDVASEFLMTLDRRDTAVSQGSEFNQALVQYFFDNLCRIHTVLNDTAEPFKALVRRYLNSSPLLHKSVVCMAAAHCFQDDESMLPVCLECHTAAVRSLSEAIFQIESVLEQSTGSTRKSALSDDAMLRKLEETLLASIILGFCAVCVTFRLLTGLYSTSTVT